jgi:A/G-specific adenine glycosylase
MDFQQNILNWYALNKRTLPWRSSINPYVIWITEIIFQQTRIEQGLPYYENFIQKFPSIHHLAHAKLEEVLKNWQGLGYYNRAKNLHFTANYIINNLNGVFPTTYEELLKLKGIGKYTAAIISSICFNEKIPAIDGNAFRVYSRFFGIENDISLSKTYSVFYNVVKQYLPTNAGDFNQAIMDYGTMICTPKNPKCNECVISKNCIAFHFEKIHQLPVKINRTKVQFIELKYFVYFSENYILIKKRIKNDFWKDLYDFPEKELLQNQRYQREVIKHKLSHRDLTIMFHFLKLKDKELIQLNTETNLYLFNKIQTNLTITFPKPIDEFINKFILNSANN